MDTYDLEKRIETLENELEDLNGRFITLIRSVGWRLGDLEFHVRNIRDRLKDFDKIEKIVFDDYLKNNLEAQSDLRTLDDMADAAAYFANLPTIKDARARRSRL
jgi:hypothetical protein